MRPGRPAAGATEHDKSAARGRQRGGRPLSGRVRSDGAPDRSRAPGKAATGPASNSPRRTTGPGAIFASSGLIALGVLRALHEQDVQVPEGIAIVSLDGSWETEYSWPALSSVRQPIEAMAEASADRLLDQHSAERREGDAAARVPLEYRVTRPEQRGGIR
ncbi:substrate-binding domain-containing protein [Nonomuraea angiospora]|uniref:substrate-binding domain-containing protein n=1 Tax=Nonomuraea angiospora TaxID=46172 RepID=UPI0036225B66